MGHTACPGPCWRCAVCVSSTDALHICSVHVCLSVCCALQEPTSTLPDVWYQLLMFCAGSPTCCWKLWRRQPEVLEQVQLAGYDATLLQLAVSEGVAEEAYQARYKAHMDAQGLTRYQAPPVVAD